MRTRLHPVQFETDAGLLKDGASPENGYAFVSLSPHVARS